jgi:hypothetical protein
MSSNAFRGPFNFVWSGIDDLGLRACAQIIQDGSGYRVANKNDFGDINITGANISIGSVGITGAGGTPVSVASVSGSNAMAVYVPSGIKIEGGSSRIEGIRATGVSGSNIPQPVLGGGLVVTGVSGTFTNGTLQNLQQDQFGNIWVSLGTAISSNVDSIVSLISGSGNVAGVDSIGRLLTLSNFQDPRVGITGSNGTALTIQTVSGFNAIPVFQVSGFIGQNQIRGSGLVNTAKVDDVGRLFTSSVISGSGSTNLVAVDEQGRAKVLASVIPGISGGLSTYKNLDLNQSGFSIKGTAGQIYGWWITNRSASERCIKLYDTTGVPNVGVMTPTQTMCIPGSTAANVSFSHGIMFVSGIGIACVTSFADNSSGAPTANDIVVDIFYK